ncbi:MAG: zinc ribbon domain-containing protein [Anaerolineae bacterium]
MNTPSLEAIVSVLTVASAILGALLAALWLSLIFWAVRDMRQRTRDPFAHLLAAVVVAVLPIFGVLIYLILRPQETLAEAYERALEEEALLQEIEERPTCPGCSRTIDSNWLLCAYCHTRLKKACPDCHSLMDLQWTLCPFCGNNHVDPYHVEVQQDTAAPAGEAFLSTAAGGVQPANESPASEPAAMIRDGEPGEE